MNTTAYWLWCLNKECAEPYVPIRHGAWCRLNLSFPSIFSYILIHALCEYKIVLDGVSLKDEDINTELLS